MANGHARQGEAFSLLQQVSAKPGLEHTVKGFTAEAWHTGTFNVDAARRGLKHLSARMPADTGKVDIVVSDGAGELPYQVKFYRTASDTATQLSHPAYRQMGKVGPGDQFPDIPVAALERAARQAPHRPEQAANLRHTADVADDRIRHGGAESEGLTHRRALELTKRGKAGTLDRDTAGFRTADVIQWRDIARESGKAARTAFLTSAIMGAAPHLIQAIEVARREQRIPTKELWRAAAGGIKGGAAGCLRGGVAAALTAAARSGLLGTVARSVSGSAIGAATALFFQAAGDAFRLSRGEMTSAEFAERTAQNVSVAGFAAAGAALGQAIIPIPVVGMLVGGFIGSMVGAKGFATGKRALLSLGAEAHETQLELAVGVLALARSVEICAAQSDVLVRIQRAAMRQLSVSVAHWQENHIRVANTLQRVAELEREEQALAAAHALRRRRLRRRS